MNNCDNCKHRYLPLRDCPCIDCGADYNLHEHACEPLENNCDNCGSSRDSASCSYCNWLPDYTDKRMQSRYRLYQYRRELIALAVRLKQEGVNIGVDDIIYLIDTKANNN